MTFVVVRPYYFIAFKAVCDSNIKDSIAQKSHNNYYPAVLGSTLGISAWFVNCIDQAMKCSSIITEFVPLEDSAILTLVSPFSIRLSHQVKSYSIVQLDHNLNITVVAF